MTSDARGRIRFTEAGFRFEVNTNEPTRVTVYDRNFGKGPEIKLGTIDLLAGALELLQGISNSNAVEPRDPVGVGGYY